MSTNYLFKKNISFVVLIILSLFSKLMAQEQKSKQRVPGAILSKELWDNNKYIWSYSQSLLSGKKKPLDFDAIDNWRTINSKVGSAISCDGQYFCYLTEDTQHPGMTDTLYLKSTKSKWQITIGVSGYNFGFFSTDGRQFVCQNKEGLHLIQNGTDVKRLIKGIASYKVLDKNGAPSDNYSYQWVAILSKINRGSLTLINLLSNKEKEFEHVKAYRFDESRQWLVCEQEDKGLLLYNLATGQQQQYQEVENYKISKRGEAIVYKTTKQVGTNVIQTVNYDKLQKGIEKKLWIASDEFSNVGSVCIDESGERVGMFIEQKEDGAIVNSIWYWQTGMEKAALKINNFSTGVAGKYSITGPLSFPEPDNQNLQFLLSPLPERKDITKGAVMMDVWGYRDSIMQLGEQFYIGQKKQFKAIWHPETEHLTQVENETTGLALLCGNYAILSKEGFKVNNDQFWKPGYNRNNQSVVSLTDGKQLDIAGNDKRLYWAKPEIFAKNSRYVVFFDEDEGCHYYKYDFQTGKKIKLSNGISDKQLAVDGVARQVLNKNNLSLPYGLAAWLPDEDAVLVYDRFDIWQLDLSGVKKPINLTNGYGRRNHTMFALLQNLDDRNTSNKPVINLGTDGKIMLRAFNTDSKASGFYQIKKDRLGDPEELFMGAFFFDRQTWIDGLTDGMVSMRAADTAKWLVLRQSATEAPNFFTTTNFITFTQQTYHSPNAGYNWLNTEKIRFKQADGQMSQGVLYKPENFDINKKYPVIISFYGQLSDRLNQYPTPTYVTAPQIFNEPAWMVSNGYLVLTPDTHFTNGSWQGAADMINGAVNYLSKLPYVDAKHIGGVGHSNSGNFGYYILTHTHKLAAMSIGAGQSDIISSFFKQDPFDATRGYLDYIENGFYKTGLGELWKDKKKWTEHVALMQADRITTPVLIFHNQKDNAFEPGYALSMYLSLRRLEKPCWWLQYDFGYHTVGNDDARDFTIRYTQYFDHLLKGAPAPLWMTKGKPFTEKGINSRFELDPEGQCMDNCKICKQWNEQYKHTPSVFSNPISEWKLDTSIRN